MARAVLSHFAIAVLWVLLVAAIVGALDFTDDNDARTLLDVDAASKYLDEQDQDNAVTLLLVPKLFTDGTCFKCVLGGAYSVWYLRLVIWRNRSSALCAISRKYSPVTAYTYLSNALLF